MIVSSPSALAAAISSSDCAEANPVETAIARADTETTRSQFDLINTSQLFLAGRNLGVECYRSAADLLHTAD